MGTYKCLDFTCYDSNGNYSCFFYYYWKNRFMAWLKLTVLALLLCVACGVNVKTNQSFILDPSITYPEERNVAVAWPITPVTIEEIK